MVLTRQQRMDAMDHVVTTVLDQAADGAIMLALQQSGTIDILLLASLSETQIDNLKVSSTTAVPNPPILAPGHLGLIKAIVAYERWRSAMSNPIDDDWMSVTFDEFNTFRTSLNFNPQSMFATASPASTNPTAAGAATSPARDPLSDFKRGMKRDSSQFPVLKDEKQWDNWNRTACAQARAQDVAHVFDESYIPITPEDKALFQAKEIFMFAVFEKTLMTDQGKAFVRQHEKNAGAQLIYKALKEHAILSTKASIEASEILAYITSAKLGERSA